jgi:hypothetical protein
MIDMSNGAVNLPLQIASTECNAIYLSILDLVKGRHYATHMSTEKIHEKERLAI